jgi:hypothetical protein
MSEFSDQMLLDTLQNINQTLKDVGNTLVQHGEKIVELDQTNKSLTRSFNDYQVRVTGERKEASDAARHWQIVAATLGGGIICGVGVELFKAVGVFVK